MRLDDAGRDADGMALIHLVVVGLEGQLLRLGVAVGDGAFPGRLQSGNRRQMIRLSVTDR
jgi:hypothetical protein